MASTFNLHGTNYVGLTQYLLLSDHRTSYGNPRVSVRFGKAGLGEGIPILSSNKKYLGV